MPPPMFTDSLSIAVALCGLVASSTPAGAAARARGVASATYAPDRRATATRRWCPGSGASPYTGLAWTGGGGARVPIGGRLWVEPAVSALFWGGALPSARLGGGWRLR